PAAVWVAYRDWHISCVIKTWLLPWMLLKSKTLSDSFNERKAFSARGCHVAEGILPPPARRGGSSADPHFVRFSCRAICLQNQKARTVSLFGLFNATEASTLLQRRGSPEPSACAGNLFGRNWCL